MGTSFQSSVEKQLSTAFIMTSKFWWVLLMSLVAAKTSALPAPAPQDEYDEEDYEEEEEDVVQEKFAKFDENSDGQLTPDEIIDGFHTEINQTDVDEMLAGFDGDKDGKLSQDEFKQFVVAGAIHSLEEAGANSNDTEVAVRAFFFRGRKSQSSSSSSSFGFGGNTGFGGTPVLEETAS